MLNVLGHYMLQLGMEHSCYEVSDAARAKGRQSAVHAHACRHMVSQYRRMEVHYHRYGAGQNFAPGELRSTVVLWQCAPFHSSPCLEI